MCLACGLTIVLLFGVLSVYGSAVTPAFMGVVKRTFGSAEGWAAMTLSVTGANLPYVALRFFVNLGWPSLSRLVRESEVTSAVRNDFLVSEDGQSSQMPDVWEPDSPNSSSA
jgi:hypothetical protein